MNNDLKKEKKKTLEIHNKTRRAHLELDVKLMVSTFADQVFRVASGAISQSSKEEYRQNHKEYFQAQLTTTKWMILGRLLFASQRMQAWSG